MASSDSTTLLYNQEHTVAYKDTTHRYYVDKKLTPSVTTILSAVIAKPDLMLWPLNLAVKYLEDTITNGEPVTSAHLQKARIQHIQKRDKGSSVGTAVHALAEKRLNLRADRRLDISDLPEEIMLASLAFESWYLSTNPTVIATEKVVYSRKQQYAGTYDSILQINGKNYLCDLKTTNASRVAPHGIYADYFIQLGAYFDAYTEQRAYEGEHSLLVPIHDLMIISCKKDGTVDTLTCSDLGITPNDTVVMWRCVHTIHTELSKLKKQIARGST